jgi:putative ABC transport system permease protein
MIKSYFLVAWRNLWRNKTFSFIKIAGLSIGLTVCMLILLYTKDEISYDQFHENKAQLYRLTQTWKMGKEPTQKLGITNAIMGETFAQEIPEVQQFVRIAGRTVTIKKENDVLTDDAKLVDENFFSVFTFPLVEGNRSSALKDLHSIVLSEKMAKKYFGITDVIGKVLQIKMNDEFDNFTITAVVKDAPENSSITVDMLMSFKYYQKNDRNVGWLGGSMNTFFLISPQTNIASVENKMQTVFDKNTKDEIAKSAKEQGITMTITMGLQPFTSIHLATDIGFDNGMSGVSKPVYSYILSCIAIFILIIACINFINLAVAQSLKRSKEIGIRKVVGSSRGQLIKQFLAESFVTSLIAFVIAIVLTIVILPFFNELANKKLSLSYLSDGYLYVGYFLLLMLTSFIAGFYPSLVLSAFQPVKVLYSKQKLLGKNYLTRGLIVLQFALAIFLIIGTIAINAQLKYIFNKDLGYDSKNLVSINLPYSKLSDKLPALFKNELANQPSIISIAARNGGRNITGIKADGKQIVTEYNKIDDKFLPTFKIPIIAGRNFSTDYPSDTMSSVIVNESFLKEAGWGLDNAIGKTIGYMDAKRTATIVGVIRNYHFTSLKEKIGPEIFSMDNSFPFGQVWIKISPDNTPRTLALLQATFKKLIPYYPYDAQFISDITKKNYESEAKWKKIISISSGLFIFISCMGLLGLVIISIEQRRKEIGVRKVLGAAVSKIVLLISKEFIILISIAFVIAAPLGYYVVNKWLQEFAYRISIGWWMFVLAAVLVITIAILTMSFQAIRAAIANPVKSLRTE